MKAILARRLNYLRTRLHADFGDTDEQTVWLGTAPGPWTRVSVLQSHLRPSQRELYGHVSMDSGTIVLFAKKTEWPGIKVNDIFLMGASLNGEAASPATATLELKFIVTGHPSSPVLDWIRIEAAVH